MMPRNGVTAFFTEETFCRILGTETHESRLAETLRKAGITLEPANVPERNNQDGTTGSIGTSDDDLSFVQVKQEPRTFIRRKARPEPVAEVTIKTEHKQNYAASTVRTVPKQNEKTAYDKNPTMKGGAQLYLDTFERQKVLAQSDIEDNNESVVRNTASQPLIHEKSRENVEIKKAETLNSSENSVSIDGDELNQFKPKSFYKHISDVHESENTAIEEQRDDTTSGSLNTADKRPTIFRNPVEQLMSSVESHPSTSRQDSSETKGNKDEKSGPKEFKKLDPIFFNEKDRSEKNKYLPLMLKKKPRNRKSRFTCSEQRFYLEMCNQYGHYIDKDEKSTDEKFIKFQKLFEEVRKEQFAFQYQLKRIAQVCKQDYQYIHPEVTKYVDAMFLVKRKRVLKYPRYYRVEKKITLCEPDEKLPTLQYIRPLLELGTVTKLILPSIVMGLPQPCTPTNFKKIDDLSPVVKDNYRGPYVWNREVCSQDVNAEQLAIPNKCDVVMSASVVKHLIDNQGKCGRYWEIPITVREYQITEGDKKVLHRVAFLDKPFIRSSGLTTKDKIQLFQKHGIKAVAKRQQLRGHAFVGVKPIHTIEKAPKLEVLEKELNEFETGLKEIMDKRAELKQQDPGEADVDMDDKEDNEKLSGHAGDKRKRRRKKGKGTTRLGMFDLDPDDVDNLETFGMDTVNLATVKGGIDNTTKVTSPKRLSGIQSAESDNISPVTSPKRLSGVQSAESDNLSLSKAGEITRHTSGGKSLKIVGKEDELEKLKQELQGIKALAKQDSVKRTNVLTQISESHEAKKPHTSEETLLSPKSFYHNVPEPRTLVKYGEEQVTTQTDKSKGSETPQVLAANENLVSKTTSIPTENTIESSNETMDTMKKSDENVVQGESSVSSDVVTEELVQETTDLEAEIETKRTTRMSVKLSESLTAKMQQMSVIKSKLRLRSGSKEKQEEKCHLDTVLTGKTQMLNVQQVQKEPESKQSDARKLLGVSSRQKSVPAISAFDDDDDGGDDDDSDDENGGLVIDVSGDEMKISSPKRKPLRSFSEPAQQVTPVSHIAPQKVDNLQTGGVELSPLNSSATLAKTDREISETSNEISISEKSNVKTRAAKRKSTSGLTNDTPVFKRTLRSSVSAGELEDSSGLLQSKGSNLCESVQSDTQDTISELKKEVKQEIDIVMTESPGRGRGRKRNLTIERVTRSRSTSIEVHTASTTLPPTTGRVTRRSLGSVTAVPEEETTAPVKKRRGRPPKNKQSETNDNASIAVGETTNVLAEKNKEITNELAEKNKETTNELAEKNKETTNELAEKNKEITNELAEKNKEITNELAEKNKETTNELAEKNKEITNELAEKNKEITNELAEKNKEITNELAEKNKEITNELAEKNSEQRIVNSEIVEMHQKTEDIEGDGQEMEPDIASPRKRKAPQIIEEDDDDLDDDDDDAKSLTIDENPITKDKAGLGRQTRGKSGQKSARDAAEAKKIKDLADAMKKKVEDHIRENALKTQERTPTVISETKQGHTSNKLIHNSDTTAKGDINSCAKTSPENLNMDAKTRAISGQEKQNSVDMNSRQYEREAIVKGKQLVSKRGLEHVKQTGQAAHGVMPAPEVNFGIDSILQNSSVFRPRADVNKGSIIDSVAAKSGMSHLALPVDDNVVYHQWSIGGINTLIRAKYHGFVPGKGLVHVAPKIEYQPFFGFEKDMANETGRNWISIYIRPNSSLIRPRVNPFNSEIMKMDEVEYKDLIPQDSPFSMNQAFSDLHIQLQNIKELPTGQFLMKNNPRKHIVTIMKATGETDSGVFDLHLHHASFVKTNSPPAVQWVPIDTRLLLPHQRKMNLVPCTYPPKDMTFTPGQNKKVKKKKRKNRARE